LRATKQALKRLREPLRAIHGDDLVAMCFTSADFAEGVESFLRAARLCGGGANAPREIAARFRGGPELALILAGCAALPRRSRGAA
jgi:hypothetical protein